MRKSRPVFPQIIIKALVFTAFPIILLACNSSKQVKEKPVSGELSINISSKYLNLPVSQETERSRMRFEAEGYSPLELVIRLAPAKPDYWVFLDVSEYKGKMLKISFTGNPEGLKNIYQDNVIAGADSLYSEINRPQIHFTSRRGWNNDPNGLVYFEGEYHMFYQHNPFEREWENMSWGHAVSKDLIHWEELPVVLYPDSLGSIFSGTAVIDYNNTSGFGKDGYPPMVAIYTANSPDNERQCIAYSLDKGRHFTKFNGNPVIDSKSKWNSTDLRDPKVFWYEPDKNWVMVLFERDGNSIYTSENLKEWTYRSHTSGFWECPQFFELKVDGNEKTKKWVMYGASGTYMTGSFDGKKFTPEKGKYCYNNGSLYAAQTFDNMPASDGRRIQIGWGRIQQPGMPFNQMMLIPTELTLRTAKDGLRLFNSPVKEIEILQGKEYSIENADAQKADLLLNQFRDSSALRIKTTIELSHATDAGIALNGQQIFRYDMNFNLINGLFFSPEDMTSMEITADIIIDRTSVEVFINEGALSYALERRPEQDDSDGFKFFGNRITVKSLKVYPMRSIWK
jgi:fructan beta-fructosidase